MTNESDGGQVELTAADHDSEQVTLSLEVARHLFDLATDSPLICSGNFDSGDVVVLRTLAEAIGIDPEKATPDEFIRDYPHTFQPTGLYHVQDWVEDGIQRLETPWRTGRPETQGETLARLGGSLPDACTAGTYDRRCGRPESDPVHTHAHTRVQVHAS